MNSLSRDASAPPMGPGYLRLTAWPYRLEMAVGALAVIVVLFYWRLFVVGDLNVWWTIFWLLWPDLLSFVPMAPMMLRRGEWPSWGPLLYNLPHSFLVWGIVFAGWSLLVGGIEWPLLGWAAHLAADRAFGYYLRAGTGLPSA